MASLYNNGILKLDQEFIHENGITGSTYTGNLIETTRIGEYDAVVPEITGSAWITGFNQLVLDSRDPIGDGFFVGF
jgi:proline racemase